MNDLIEDYSVPVYSTIFKRDNILGISPSGFYLIAGLTFFILVILEDYKYLLFIPILYIIIKVLQSIDEFLIEIILDNILSPDIFL